MGLPTTDFRGADAARQFASSMHDTCFAILVGHPFDSRIFATIASEWLAFFSSGAAGLAGSRCSSRITGHRPGLRADDRKVDRLDPADPALPSLTGNEPPGSFRSLEHEDLNLITLLATPTAPGLQVKTSTGDWLDIPSDDSLLVENDGRMLNQASGGLFPAALRRVHQPELEIGSRLSFPLLVHPRADVDLGGDLTVQVFLARHVAELQRCGWAVVPGGVAGKG